MTYAQAQRNTAPEEVAARCWFRALAAPTTDTRCSFRKRGYDMRGPEQRHMLASDKLRQPGTDALELARVAVQLHNMSRRTAALPG